MLPLGRPVMLSSMHSLPVATASRLLQRQFARDQALAWKFELVRRRDQLAKTEAEAQVTGRFFMAAAAAAATVG